MLATSAKLPVSNLKEFITWGKNHPDRLTYASSGAGGGGQLSALLFAKAAGLEAINVPYKGIASAIPDMASGQVAFAFDGVQSFSPHLRSGKLRAIGIAGPSRLPAAPDVPTLAESGLAGFNASSWLGILAPGKTPSSVVATLSNHIAAVVRLPEVRQRLVSFGIEPIGSTPASFQAFLLADSAKWGAVIREANLKIEQLRSSIFNAPSDYSSNEEQPCICANME